MSINRLIILYNIFYANHFYFYHLDPIIIGPLIPIGLDGGIILDSIIDPNIEIITYLGLLIAPLSTAAAPSKAVPADIPA